MKQHVPSQSPSESRSQSSLPSPVGCGQDLTRGEAKFADEAMSPVPVPSPVRDSVGLAHSVTLDLGLWTLDSNQRVPARLLICSERTPTGLRSRPKRDTV
jgi:hypothetical protein